MVLMVDFSSGMMIMMIMCISPLPLNKIPFCLKFDMESPTQATAFTDLKTYGTSGAGLQAVLTFHCLL